MKNKFYILISIIIILLSTIIISFPKIYTLCADIVKPSNSFFEAKIYDNAQYNLGSSGIELTEQGVDITSWNYNNSKYLKITTNLPNDLVNSNNNVVIGIKLPKEFYFSVNDFLLPIGCNNVRFEKNDDFIVNTNYTYHVNNHSGTVYYTINPGVTSITIQLEIKYDFELWNKLGHSLINQKNEKSILVKLYKQDSNEQLISKSVNNAYSEQEYKMIAGSIPYINDKRNEGDIDILYKDRKNTIIRNSTYVMAEAQSEMKAFFKEIRFKIKLPEFIDKNNKKHYMEIDKSSIKFSLDTGGKIEYIIDESDLINGNTTIIIKNIYYETKGERIFIYALRPPEFGNIEDLNVINFNRLSYW